MSLAAARLIATLALLVALVSPVLAVAVAGPAGDPAGSRQVAYRAWQEARDNEARLRQELLDVEVRLRRARDEADRLAREAAASATALTAARAHGDEVRQRLTTQRRRVSRWLRFLSENGAVSFLDVLMGSTDFADFTDRWETISRLIEYNVAVLRELKALRAEAQRVEAELAQRQQALAALAGRRREAADLLAQRSAEREAALAEARRLLGERAAALAELDRRWAEDLPTLAYFLVHLRELPWDQVQPESFRVNPLAGTVRVEVSEAALSRALTSGDPRLGDLRLRLLPGQLAVTGGEAGGFTLTGTLTITGERVAFVPTALEFEGALVGEETLGELVSGSDLTFDLSRSTGFMQLRGLEVTDGRLILDLGR